LTQIKRLLSHGRMISLLKLSTFVHSMSTLRLHGTY